MNARIKEAADWAIGNVQVTAAELRKVKGLSLGSLKAVARVLGPVVKEVEGAKKRFELGPEDAQALAVELICRLVPKPFWIPAGYWRDGIAYAVDIAVELLQDRFR